MPMATKVAVGRETTLASVADRTRLAFRADGDVHRAKVSTHHTEVEGGTLRMTPFHHDKSAVQTGSPLTVVTKGLVRGADDYDIDLRSTKVDASTGQLVLDRGGHVERLRNSEAGVEQTWTFAMPPDGIGDLTVKVGVSGHPYIAETDSGLHFGQAGKLGFRYSHAIWVDANGIETPIKARWANKQIELTVPEDVLVNSAYPAVLDPTVAAEVAIDTPVAGWVGSSSFESAIASSGSDFLVVWVDSRGTSTDIYGTRLSSAGTVLDTTGIAINAEGETADNPAVSFVNGEYVVVWDNGTSVRSARVSTAGTVSSSSTVGAGVEPEIASRGSDALVAYRTGSDINAALFSGGSFGGAINITTGVTSATPSVGANPSGAYLVTWTEGAANAAPNLRGRFVSGGAASGAAFDIAATPGAQNDASTSWNGTNFVTVWSNNNNGVDIYGALVSTAGAVTPAGGLRLTTAANNQFQPALSCTTAGTCLATWTDRRTFGTTANDVYGIRLDSALSPIGTDFVIAAAADEQREPSVVASGSDWRVAFDDTSHGGTVTVLSAAVSAAGAAGSAGNVAVGTNQQERPATAGSPTQFFITHADTRAVGHDIYGGRVSAAGAALDASGVAVSAATRTQYNPASAFDGTNFATVWEDNRSGTNDIYFARTNAAGALLDASGIAVSAATGDQTLPAIAYGNGSYLVAWQDGRAGNFDLYAAIVTPGGSVTVADIGVCTNASNQRAPAVAYDTANNVFLVTWHDNRTGIDRAYAARVSATGSVLDNCGVAITSTAVVQNTTSVAAGGGRFLVAWTSGPDNSGDVFAARITATTSSLTVLDPTGMPLATGNGITQRESAAAFVAGAFTVAWQQNGDILGQVVRLDGTFDGTVFTISNNPELEARPSVAAGGSGVALVSYERDVASPVATRVATRRLNYVNQPTSAQACSTDAQCASGFCVDNFCCDTACGNNSQTDCQACAVNKGGSVNGMCTTIALARNWRCRGYADTFCDLIEVCNGVDASCPADVGRRQGVTCNIAGGGSGTCPPNDVSGAPHVCQ